MQQQEQDKASQNSQDVRQEPKQPWHKPTVTFVPLKVTAEASGTTSDGLAQSTTIIP